jgi:hypothetical protein
MHPELRADAAVRPGNRRIPLHVGDEGNTEREKHNAKTPRIMGGKHLSGLLSVQTCIGPEMLSLVIGAAPSEHVFSNILEP